MRLTPIEIRSHRFNSRLRGYDHAEVEAFLDTVVSDFEEVVRENAQLRRETERVGRELETYKGREENIQQTLTTAQAVVDQLKRTAMKEAEVLVSEAELRAEKLIGEAESRRCEINLQLAELRHLRNRLSTELRQTLSNYSQLIDAYEDAQAPDAVILDEDDKDA